MGYFKIQMEISQKNLADFLINNKNEIVKSLNYGTFKGLSSKKLKLNPKIGELLWEIQKECKDFHFKSLLENGAKYIPKNEIIPYLSKDNIIENSVDAWIGGLKKLGDIDLLAQYGTLLQNRNAQRNICVDYMPASFINGGISFQDSEISKTLRGHFPAYKSCLKFSQKELEYFPYAKLNDYPNSSYYIKQYELLGIDISDRNDDIVITIPHYIWESTIETLPQLFEALHKDNLIFANEICQEIDLALEEIPQISLEVFGVAYTVIDFITQLKEATPFEFYPKYTFNPKVGLCRTIKQYTNKREAIYNILKNMHEKNGK